MGEGVTLRSACASATKPPVIAAVRVPPSAWMTSQSTMTLRGPSALRSTAARSAPDEALDLEGPAAGSSRDALALASLGSAARQHRVLRGHPPRALALEVLRDA